MGSPNASRAIQLEHPALLYSNLDDFLATTVPFLTTDRGAGEVVFVAARGDYLPALEAELGGASATARLVDTYEWHPHPASRLRAFYELITEELAAGNRAFRLIGEPVWPEGPPEFVREWQRYESALNAVLAPFPVSLLCLYDGARLDPAIVATARRTHPVVHENGAGGANHDFIPPEDFLRRWNPQLPPPPRGAVQSQHLDLSAARRFINERATDAGVDPERAMDLCVAANEILTNSTVHAGGPTALWTWSTDDRFICQIEDRGDGVSDPLAGYRPFSGGQGGRGLWLARQLVDLLQVASGSRGTTVRLSVDRS